MIINSSSIYSEVIQFGLGMMNY